MKNLMTSFILFLFCVLNLTFAKDYSVDGVKFKVEKLFDGDDVIWGFDFLNADEIIFSERGGKLKYYNLKTTKYFEISGAPKVAAIDQGGLLDVFYDQKDKYLYLTYSDPDAPNPTTSLFRGRLSADKTQIKGERLFQAKAFDKRGVHFGSRVLVDRDGFIFMSIGERNKRDMAQKLDNHQGKILRLTKEGKAPQDNPFVNTKNALPEIWTYGHRNPQGLAFNKEGVLYNAEMGPRGGDEVNLIEKGANYGWPEITYGREYYGPKIGTTAKEGMKQPVLYWVPSINPSGMTFYTGKAFKEFDGHLFMATLSGHLHRVVMKDNKIIKEDKLLEDMGERNRQIKGGPDGYLYFSTDSGKLFRLLPKTSN